MNEITPLVSIVILDYDGQAFWDDLIHSLSGQVFRNFELVVVDNKGSLYLSMYTTKFDIRIIRNNRNVGFAEGCNQGVRQSKGKYIALLNNDTYVEPNWLQKLVDAMDSSTSVGAVCSRVVFFKRFHRVTIQSKTFVPSVIGHEEDRRELGLKVSFNDVQFAEQMNLLRAGCHDLEQCNNSYWFWTSGSAEFWIPRCPIRGKLDIRIDCHPELAGSKASLSIDDCSQIIDLREDSQIISVNCHWETGFDIINNVGCAIGRNWKIEERGLCELDRGQYEKSAELDAASGCAMLFRRNALIDQPFDPAYFAYCEDIDLSLTLKRNGYRIVYEPKSVVRHHRSGTSGVQSPLSVFYGVRNRFWVIAKHAPLKVVWNAVRKEMWELKRYEHWLDEEYSLSRLYWSTWTGFFKRLLVRILDLD